MAGMVSGVRGEEWVVTGVLLVVVAVGGVVFGVESGDLSGRGASVKGAGDLSGAAESSGQAESSGDATESGGEGAAGQGGGEMATYHIVRFPLLSGGTVYGRILTQDRNGITIEQLEGDDLVVREYGSSAFDRRSLYPREMTEAGYYHQLGDLFAARAWDFHRDPDNFIQAIRCYERALRVLASVGREESSLAEDLRESVEKVRADRELWQQEAQSRATLSELEFRARYDQDMSEVKASLSELADELGTLKEAIVAEQTARQEAVSDLEGRVAEELSAIRSWLEDHREELKDLWRELRRPRVYYAPLENQSGVSPSP